MCEDVVGDARRGRLAAAILTAIVLAAVAPATPALGAVVFGQLDDFEDGTTAGWSEGAPSPNPPVNVPTGGPQGDDDAFVSNTSAGGFGPGSRQIMFNQAQWIGDYSSAGVTRISGWVANLGSTPLSLRVAIEGGATRFGSASAFGLPPDGLWRRVSFDLTDSGMTRISGALALSAVLSGVTDFRLLSAMVAPASLGDSIPATLAVDDLRARRPEGDANFDGNVNGADLRVVRSNLGTASGAAWARGDFNFDGRVNALDVQALRRNLVTSGAPGGAVSVVPEPGWCAPLVLSWLCLSRTRRAARAR